MFPHHFFPVYFFVVGKPENYVPTFQAHRVEVAPHTFNRLKYQVEDSSGDGVVFQITNNGHLPVHICLVSFQSDGSIFVLYPTANRASHFFWFCFIIGHCALLYRKKVFTSLRRTFFSLVLKRHRPTQGNPDFHLLSTHQTNIAIYKTTCIFFFYDLVSWYNNYSNLKKFHEATANASVKTND